MVRYAWIVVLLCGGCVYPEAEAPKATKTLPIIVVVPRPVILRQRTGPVSVVSASPAVVSKAPSKPSFYVIRCKVTAYCPCERCCGQMTGKTSTKTNAWKPGVAVDPRAIPYGSLVEIPGYERAEITVADDTGGALRRAWRRGKIQFDVRMEYHWQARDWGVQYLDVKVFHDADLARR